MIFLKNSIKLFDKYFYYINIKILKNFNILYFNSYFGLIKYKLMPFEKFAFYKFLIFMRSVYFILNIGWISILYLNGLGFKSTRKFLIKELKYWRFNVGHSHVFQYFTPEDVILKSKNRYICMFSFNKSQLFTISQKLKTFKKLNIYKGTGIQYPGELKSLKIGKLKQ